MNDKLIVGSRGSKLAITQTNNIIGLLKQKYQHIDFEIMPIKTTGDKILDKTLNKIGGKGLFIKEIEEALKDKKIDLAVHSMKDVPHTIADDFEITVTTKREDPRDVILYKNSVDFKNLPLGFKIATSSLRRMVQLKRIFPNIDLEPIRGNIDTRINKLLDNNIDAIVLAAAGLKRLNLLDFLEDKSINIYYLDTSRFIPAVGQGSLAIETRKEDKETQSIIDFLNDPDDSLCVSTERTFLKEIDGGCEIPIGAYARISQNKIMLSAFIGDETTYELYKGSLIGNFEDYESIGIQLAEAILNKKYSRINYD